MPVTKQTYTQAPTWTAAQAAALFRQAFIDAGWMTEWFDSFLSGSIENRVLEVIYDGTKTYGKTYYWFMFTTAGVFLHVSSGWNAASDVPSGTAGVDFTATTTNATTNHFQLITLTSTIQLDLIRYTSQVDSKFSVILIRSGSTFQNIYIPPANVSRPAWLDLDRGFYHPWGRFHAIASQTGTRYIGLGQFLHMDRVMRRSLIGGASMRGVPSGNAAVWGGDAQNATHQFVFPGTANNNGQNFINFYSVTGYGISGIWMPIGLNSSNPAYPTDDIPIYSGLPWSLYINEVLPADFALAPHYANNTMVPLDTFTLAAGTNVWEVFHVSNNANLNIGPSIMWLARTVG